MGFVVSKLASGAGLCYNRRVNFEPLQVLKHSRGVSQFWIGELTMDTITPHDQNGNPLKKKCTGPCGRTLDATSEYFHAAKKGKYGLYAKCKECRESYQNRPEILERKRAYDKDYRAVPENQERQRAYSKDYRTNPETRENLLAKKRAYYKRPEVKEYLREYRSRPEVRERNRIWHKDYYRRLGTRHYPKNPENPEKKRIRMKEYRSRSDVKEHIRIYNRDYYMRPERQERLSVWNQSYVNRPEVRERSRAKVRNRRALRRKAVGNHTADQIQQQYENQKGKCYYCHKKVGNDYHVDHVVPLSRGGSNDISNLVIACPSCNRSKHDKMPHEWPDGGRLL